VRFPAPWGTWITVASRDIGEVIETRRYSSVPPRRTQTTTILVRPASTLRYGSFIFQFYSTQSKLSMYTTQTQSQHMSSGSTTVQGAGQARVTKRCHTENTRAKHPQTRCGLHKKNCRKKKEKIEATRDIVSNIHLTIARANSSFLN